MNYNSLKEIEEICIETNKSFYEVVIEDDINERLVDKIDSLDLMKKMYNAMKTADSKYEPNIKSASGLSGGDGAKLESARQNNNILSGDFLGLVMEKAIKMGESNACMKCIVAAPTAGACGVLPSVMIAFEECFNVSEEKMIEALYVAAGIGNIIAKNASISGAQGGCQAEIGSGSAMTAGALTYLRGGTVEQINNAVALSLKSLLGLVCDPVAGLVEVPCVKRNVIGAVNAVTASDMTMAGINSKIPVDEVIQAMKEVGDLLPKELKETSCGGLAVTETAKKIEEKFGNEEN